MPVSKYCKALLARGMLPRELPPVFTSQGLGKKAGLLEPLLTENKWTKPEKFSLPKSRLARRTSFVVNPVAYFHVCQEIGTNWAVIRKSLESSIAAATPGFFGSERALREIDFNRIRQRQIVDGSGHMIVVKSDFSRFFPTIYTHSIPWAIHGKAYAKANIGKPALLGNRVDKRVQALQEGQTAGIPIGPDASYILAELVSSAIDRELNEILQGKLHGLRFVDDYTAFFSSRASAEQFVAALARAAANYQIELHPEKTRIYSIEEEASEAWVFALSSFSIATSGSRQRDTLARLTELCISLFRRHDEPAIGKYAIKKIAGTPIDPENIDFAVACSLRLFAISKHALPDVAAMICTYADLGYKIDLTAIKRFVVNVVESGISLGHDMEVCWALWLALKLKITLPASVKLRIQESNSSLVVILGRLLNERSLLKGMYLPNIAAVAPAPDDFAGDKWLLFYEGSRRGWFGWNDVALNGSMLQPLHDNNVTFLAPDAGLKSVLKPPGVVPKGPVDVKKVFAMLLKSGKPSSVKFGYPGVPLPKELIKLMVEKPEEGKAKKK